MLQDSFLYREIHQQPDAITRLLQSEGEAVERLAREIRSRRVDQIIIAARGTSDNAGRYAKYLFGAINRFVVTLAAPSLFSIYHRPPQLGNSLVLGISQSGKSPDIIAVLEEARQQGALAAVITNSPGSELAQLAEYVIDLNAGVERSVAATKTFTCELVALASLSAALAQDAEMDRELQLAPECVAAALAMNEMIEQFAGRYQLMESCIVIGRGFNYATAFEIALKLKELTYIKAEPYSSADFLHGPLALIDSGFPVIIVAPSGKMGAELIVFTQTLRQQGAEIIVISDDPSLLGLADTQLSLPVSVPEWISPVISVVPGQLLAMHMAHIGNKNLDHPRGIFKITETI